MDHTISPWSISTTPDGTRRMHGADCTCGWQFTSLFWEEVSTELLEHRAFHRANGEHTEVV